MKKTESSLRATMDRRLAFLDELPSCRSALQLRIAQEEEPVMKRKLSFGLIVAFALALLSVAALAAGLLLSPRVSAARLADQALEKNYGITAEMQTFFLREETELPDGAVQVTYTGAGDLSAALGTYTAIVRNGQAEISWNHDGKAVSEGYDSDVWGLPQIKQMMSDSLDAQTKKVFMDKAHEIAERSPAPDTLALSEPVDDDYFEKREAAKTAAMQARKLSEEEMIAIGREFIISSFALNDAQVARMELFTVPNDTNSWYEMVNDQPCFQVEYLLYGELDADPEIRNDPKNRLEKDGYYIAYVNVETGAIEQYEYNSALAGEG